MMNQVSQPTYLKLLRNDENAQK